MKTMSLLHSFGRSAGLVAFLLTGSLLLADGCFVMPRFVWNKAKDINEPSQKAIIFFDNGREDLILRVKYEGPVSEFGWLIPVPARPTVAQVPMACFYELSKFVQMRMQPHVLPMSLSSGRGGGGGGPSEPKVKVLEEKTLGAYEIAVLSADDAGALQEWLAKNKFQFPEGKEAVLDHYVQKHWFFVAVRVNLNPPARQTLGHSSYSQVIHSANNVEKSRDLHRGELNPLALTFDSPQCVFPLKISSAAGKPSEVHIDTLGREPMTNAVMSRISAAETNKTKTYPGYSKGFVPAWNVTKKDLPKSAKTFLRFGDEHWILAKQEATFEADQMEDLEFQSAFPAWLPRMDKITNISSAEQKYIEPLAAQELWSLVPAGRTALIKASESSDSAARQNAAEVLGRLKEPDARQLVLKLLRDDDLGVRVAAAQSLGFEYSNEVCNALAPVLHNYPSRITMGALSQLAHQRYFLNPEHQRELIPVLSNPDGQAAFFAFTLVRNVATPEQLKPMLEHSDPFVRLVALRKLEPQNKFLAGELCIEMFSRTNRNYQMLASDTLHTVTGQKIADSEAWKAWWSENKGSFRSDQK